MSFRLAVVQFRPEKGETDKNLARIGSIVRQAADQKADIVLFPESAVQGYHLEGGVEELALTQKSLTERLASHLRGLSRPIDIALGFYERSTDRPYNSAAYLTASSDGCELVHCYRKFFLPTYGVFDERRFHQAGNDLGLVETRFGKIGLLICEDVWHSIMGSCLAVAGAETVLVLAASPARGFDQNKPGNVLRYERMLSALAEEHGVHVGAAMLIGFEGGKGLAGGSLIVSPYGDTVVQAKVIGEQILYADINPEDVYLARSKTPLVSDLFERFHAIYRSMGRFDPEN